MQSPLKFGFANRAVVYFPWDLTNKKSKIESCSAFIYCPMPEFKPLCNRFSHTRQENSQFISYFLSLGGFWLLCGIINLIWYLSQFWFFDLKLFYFCYCRSFLTLTFFNSVCSIQIVHFFVSHLSHISALSSFCVQKIDKITAQRFFFLPFQIVIPFSHKIAQKNLTEFNKQTSLMLSGKVPKGNCFRSFLSCCFCALLCAQRSFVLVWEAGFCWRSSFLELISGPFIATFWVISGHLKDIWSP